jgi:hypothetical protein
VKLAFGQWECFLTLSSPKNVFSFFRMVIPRTRQSRFVIVQPCLDTRSPIRVGDKLRGYDDEELISYRRKEFVERWAAGDVALFVRVLDEFFQHDPIRRREAVTPGIGAESFFLFFQNQHR